MSDYQRYYLYHREVGGIVWYTGGPVWSNVMQAALSLPAEQARQLQVLFPGSQLMPVVY